MRETRVGYIRRQLTYETETHKHVALDAAAVRGVIYAAVQPEDKSTAQIYTRCAVVLFSNNKREGFGYKVMDETMGPYEANCPDRIMRLLSPLQDIPCSSDAETWRERVEACKAAGSQEDA
jgi:hypothetical protein